MRGDNLTRRGFLRSASLGTAALAAMGAVCAKPPPRKPNIILIMADDLGYGDLGCYGGKAIATPHLDALAAAGLRFTDFHANGPVCSPTRAALLTGRYQQRAGIDGVVTARNHRHTGMALEEVTFAEVLREAGYATALFGKWHLGYAVDFNPSRQGFDKFRGYVSGNVDYHSHVDQEGYADWWRDCENVPEDGYTTDLITAHGVRFIEAHQDRPFCLYLPHEAPHYPYQGRKDTPVRAPGKPGLVHGARRDDPAAYQEMVEVMDEGIGRIVETVKRLGLEANTVLFFCSDNGATKLGSNAPLAGYKGSLWEGGHRVPAIAAWPAVIASGAVTHETAMTMDLFPTLAALAGAPLPDGLALDGLDLSPVLREQKPLAARTLFWHFQGQTAVRRGPWKLLGIPAKKRGKEAAKRLLFHLDDDLGEKTDVAGAHPERVRAMHAELDTWMKDVSKGVTMRT